MGNATVQCARWMATFRVNRLPSPAPAVISRFECVTLPVSVQQLLLSTNDFTGGMKQRCSAEAVSRVAIHSIPQNAAAPKPHSSTLPLTLTDGKFRIHWSRLHACYNSRPSHPP